MNLLVKKFRPLVVILLAGLIAISCEDPGRIGLIINSDNGVISAHYQDIVLPTAVVQFNPRKTANSRSIQSGQYMNPDFGLITSKSYSQLSVSIPITPDENSTYESFEMAIKFASFLGDEPLNSETQRISVYQLAEDIDPDGDYTRLDDLILNSAPLGNWVFAPKRNDTIQSDTVFIVPLDDVVGAELFQKLKSGDEIFNDDESFNAYFKGVAFVPSDDNIDIFQMDPNEVNFIVNYNEFNSDGTPIPRSYELGINEVGFHHIDSDVSGTPLSGISSDNSDFFPSDDYRYLQYGTMMALRVDLTPFFELSDTLEHMVINKAVIHIGEPKQYGENLEPPVFLQSYFTDETNVWPVVDDIGRLDSTQVGVDFIMVQDESKLIPPGAYLAPQSSFYDPDNKFYDINMSWFLQNLYSGNFHSDTQPFLEEKGQMFIFGESSVVLPQKTSSHTLTIPLAVHKDSIRLRIHYTVPTDIINN